VAGLLAAWLSPGYGLGNSSGLQLPVEAARAWAPGTSLLSQLVPAAGTDSYGCVLVSGSLLQLLLHAALLQAAQQQPRRDSMPCAAGAISWQSAGLQQLLLGMLAAALPLVKDLRQQQVLLAALGRAAAASEPASAQASPWVWLRQQLGSQHSPALAAAAARALVAASNRLVVAAAEEPATADGAGRASLQQGAAPAVVLPQQQQQALLLADMMQALLPYAALWPELTVQRLLQDGMQHRCGGVLCMCVPRSLRMLSCPGCVKRKIPLPPCSIHVPHTQVAAAAGCAAAAGAAGASTSAGSRCSVRAAARQCAACAAGAPAAARVYACSASPACHKRG
jgi:hypothetical protein